MKKALLIALCAGSGIVQCGDEKRTLVIYVESTKYPRLKSYEITVTPTTTGKQLAQTLSKNFNSRGYRCATVLLNRTSANESTSINHENYSVTEILDSYPDTEKPTLNARLIGEW